MSEQINKVISEFTKQSESYNDYQKSFSNEEYNDFAISNMHLNGTEAVLEVAAGTCAFGRSIAPFVSHITEFDVTEAMLNVGKAEALKQRINNVSYVLGEAEHLPFADNTFDVVMSRLAFHHFADIETVYAEMVRVLKPDGKIVVIDMEAREESLRETADSLERLRDPSHTKCVSKREFLSLAEKFGMQTVYCETIRVPVSVESWIKVTGVRDPIKSTIISAFEADIDFSVPTGFEPYRKDGKLCFDHRWMLLVATCDDIGTR